MTCVNSLVSKSPIRSLILLIHSRANYICADLVVIASLRKRFRTAELKVFRSYLQDPSHYTPKINGFEALHP